MSTVITYFSTKNIRHKLDEEIIRAMENSRPQGFAVGDPVTEITIGLTPLQKDEEKPVDGSE